jgi:hypothetical protein
MTTINPGIYAGMQNDEYHRGPGISKSGLDLIARSPAHYRFATDAANDNARQPTAAQRVGSMLHKLVLEPDSFWSEYAEPFVAPEDAISTADEIKERLRAIGEKVTGTKAELTERLRFAVPSAVFVEDARAEWADSVGDREVITPEELATAEAMAAAIFAHPLARALFVTSDTEAELSAYWNDPITGVLCRCRPDLWRADGILVDLKTTDDASPEEFSRSVLNWRYHVQAAMYLDGIALAIDQLPADVSLPPGVQVPREMVFVAVEKKPPHAVAVYRLDADAMEIGRREYRRDLDSYARCLASGVWPAYGDQLMPLSLPDWFVRRELGVSA